MAELRVYTEPGVVVHAWLIFTFNLPLTCIIVGSLTKLVGKKGSCTCASLVICNIQL